MNPYWTLIPKNHLLLCIGDINDITIVKSIIIQPIDAIIGSGELYLRQNQLNQQNLYENNLRDSRETLVNRTKRSNSAESISLNANLLNTNNNSLNNSNNNNAINNSITNSIPIMNHNSSYKDMTHTYLLNNNSNSGSFTRMNSLGNAYNNTFNNACNTNKPILSTSPPIQNPGSFSRFMNLR